MRIQLSNTHANGKADVVAQQHRPGQPLRIQAVPGGTIAVEIDGQRLTGSATIKGKRPVLLRRDDDLLVLIDDEPVAIVDGYYVTPDTGLQGGEWVYAQTGGDAAAPESFTSPAVEASTSEAASGNGIYWALGAAGLVGGIAAAAGGGGGSGSGSKAAAPVAAPQTTVSGVVVAGPLIEGHGLSVTFYKGDGSVLAGPVAINADGRFTAQYDRSYTGPIVAKVTDSSTGHDYVDEATGQGKSLDADLRAIFVSENQGEVDLVITPMSELAARFMGLPAGDSNTGKLTTSEITKANQTVAKSLGLEGGLFQAVVPVVDAAGSPVAKPNQAGLMLMAVSGLESVHGTDGAMTLLSEAIAAADEKEVTGLLISGTREASQLNQRDFVTLWTDTAPASGLAQTVKAASLITDLELQAWTAAHVATLGIDVLAALSPAQMAQLSAQAVGGLTVAQLKMLDSGTLAGLMASHVLNDAQVQALSPQTLAWAMGLPTMRFTIQDDAKSPAHDVVQREGRAATNDSTPILSGRLAAKLPEGAELAVYNGATKLGSAVVQADSQAWSFTPGQAWPDGVYALDFRVQTRGGKASSASTPVMLTIDTVNPDAPVLQLTQDLGRPGDLLTSSGSFTVSGLEPGASWQYSINGGATWQDGSGTSFTVTEGVYAANTIRVRQTDAAGNTSVAASNPASITVDTTAPTVEIVSSEATLHSGQTSTLTFTFSEPVLDLSAANIVATNGEVANVQAVAGSQSVYTATFTPKADMQSATVSVTLKDVQDVAGNALQSPVANNLIAIDTLAPTVQITSSPHRLAGSETATIRFVFSETPAQTLRAQDITVANGRLSNLAQSADDPKVYTATFTPDAGLQRGSTATITLAAGSYSDQSGNAGTQKVFTGIDIDTQAPAVVSVMMSGLNAAGVTKLTSLRTGDKIKVTLTMDEPMQISSDAAYQIQLDGATRQARYVSGSGTRALVFEYTIQAGDTEGTDGVTATQNALVLPVGSTWTDLMGNAGPTVVPVVSARDNSIQVNGVGLVMEQITVKVLNADKTAKASGAMAKVGDIVQFTADFHDAATVNGQPQLRFTWAGREYQAQYAGGSGSSKLLFDYVLKSGDQGPRDGINVAQQAFNLPAGVSIVDKQGHSAVLNTFDFKPLQGSTDLVYSGQPSIERMWISGATGGENGWLNNGDTVTVKVAFDKEVLVTGGPRLKLLIGNTLVTANYDGPTNQVLTELSFSYTIQTDQEARSGISIPADPLLLDGGRINSSAAGAVAANLAVDGVGANLHYRVDAMHPELTSALFAGQNAAGVAKTGRLDAGDKVRIEVRMSEQVTITGRTYYEFTTDAPFTDAGTKYRATYVRTEGEVLIYEYTVKAGDNISGEYFSSASISGPGTITDLRGNRSASFHGHFVVENDKIDVNAPGVDVFGISAKQIASMSPTGNYWVRLNPLTAVTAINLGEMIYGYWTDDAGNAYHRQWEGEHADQAVNLYVQGGREQLGFSHAAYQNSTITLGLDSQMVEAPMHGSDWSIRGGQISSISSPDLGLTLTLTTAEPPGGIVELTYTGSNLQNQYYAGLKYTHLKIGTDAADTLDGSAYNGNQALFANGGGGQMMGGAGHDLLVAGSGDDRMSGGRGADTFMWGRNGGGNDTISDFVKTEGDRINLKEVLASVPEGTPLASVVELVKAAGASNDAIINVDLTGTSRFASPSFTITVINGWTDGGLSTGLQQLVNQQVIVV